MATGDTSQVSMERKQYLDAAKGVGINMIIFGHITTVGNPVDNWIGIFKISIFFIISGYLMAMNHTAEKYTAAEFLKRHGRSLMLPYIGYSIISMAYVFLRNLFLNRTLYSAWRKLLDMGYAALTLRGYSTLWFLPCLFLGQLLFLLWLKTPKVCRIVLFFLPIVITQVLEKVILSWKASLSSTTFKLISYPTLTISRSILALWFILAGYLCFMILEKWQVPLGRFLVGLAATFLTMFLSRYKGNTDINNLYVGKHPEIFYLCGILGAIGVILILEYLEHCRVPMNFLIWCGVHSLTIMATHVPLGFKALVIRGFSHVYALEKAATAKYYLEVIGIQAHLLMLECGVVQIVHQCFPFLEGKIRRKNTAGNTGK